MQEEAFNSLVGQGLLTERSSPFLEHLTERGKKAWSQVEQKMFDLADVDFSKADAHCDRCNGTGILRNSNIGGVLTTIVCSCLTRDREIGA